MGVPTDGRTSLGQPVISGTVGIDFMTKLLRFTSVAATVAAVALTSSPAFAGPATATANPQANAQVRILKPLILTSEQSLDLGTIALGQGPFSTTVGIARDGPWTCDTAKVTCSGTHQVARYNVAGTNNRVVVISAPDVTLSNGVQTLTLDVDAPATVNTSNSGSAGVDFDIGGLVALSDST